MNLVYSLKNYQFHRCFFLENVNISQSLLIKYGSTDIPCDEKSPMPKNSALHNLHRPLYPWAPPLTMHDTALCVAGAGGFSTVGLWQQHVLPRNKWSIVKYSHVSSTLDHDRAISVAEAGGLCTVGLLQQHVLPRNKCTVVQYSKNGVNILSATHGAGKEYRVCSIK